jgi:DNA excision repair protein ERCC-2
LYDSGQSGFVSSAPDYLRFFPYAEPYPHQREAMDDIAGALSTGRDVLFEGACGTGKTLAALAPALEHARETDRTVVITTNVHQQMRQFVREASAITAQEAIRAVVFRGKASMCHIDVGYEECQTLRDTTRDLVEAEREVAELESKQHGLLERMQAGDDAASEARSAIMDELDAAQAEVADFADRATCDHYYANLTTGTDDFFAWLYEDVRTPDDVYAYADEQGLCGYELLKEGVEGVDLVVCNYHHLLDPNIREQFFRWLGRDPDEVIAVFDEAHNVEDAARDHARRTCTETTLARALDECQATDDPRTDDAANVLGTFLAALRTAVDEAFGFGERAQVEDAWYDLAIVNEDRRDDLTLTFLRAYEGPGIHEDLTTALELGEDLDSAYAEAYREGEDDQREECQILQAARFCEAWVAEAADPGLYPVVSVRRGNPGGAAGGGGGGAGGGNGAGAAGAGGGAAGAGGAGTAGGTGGSGDSDIYARAELYTCIPERVTRTLFDDLHASVLMSATLRPFEVTSDVLGLDEAVATMAFGEQFPEERRRTFAVDGPALFASKRDDEAVQRTVGDALADAIRLTPGNTLCFFPSYAEAARYHERLQGSAAIGGAETYLDEAGTPARDLREEFVASESGALFSSLWGTLGEGVSYDGDDARTVVVVGVPYPHLDERMEAVQAAYDAAFDLGDAGPASHSGESPGWRYAVEIPTVRKTRQALGRVVRSPEDFGARVLLDARYTERAEVEMHDYAVRGIFPPEERAEMIDLQPEKLKFAMLNFYGDLDAYEGEPPRP